MLEAAKKGLDNLELSMEKLSYLATDGAPSMKGRKEGFCNIFKSVEKVNVPSFHCIIHQESFCCQLCKLGSLHYVMQEVIKIVNIFMLVF